MKLKDKIKNTFIKKFGNEPLVVSSPGRINLIGEHTDYNDGFVLPAAINKYIYAAISRSPSNLCSVYALDNNETYQFSLDELNSLPSATWHNYVIGVVAELIKKTKRLRPFNLVFGGNIPHGSGLSSSAALENSIVFALNELFHLELTKQEMILISQRAEHNYVGVKCGIMDQFSSMFGVKDHALFLDCRTLDAKTLKVDFKNFEVILINSNVKHNLAENEYNERRAVCEKVAKVLNVKALRDATKEQLENKKGLLTDDEYEKADYIIQENLRVLQTVKLINENNIEGVGELLYQAHSGMREKYKISCEEIDFLVDKTKTYPFVLGSRLMGGGFGGCTINIVASDRVNEFIKNMRLAYKNKFNRECSVYQLELSNGTELV